MCTVPLPLGVYPIAADKYINKLTDTGRCYGMEMNVEKTKVMRISRQTFPVKNYDRPKTTRKCLIF